jgi:uncharacterized membrane protein YgcG
MRKNVARASIFCTQTAVALVAAGMSGCAVVDHFAPRATDYNYQTGDAKSGIILLNVVRAAYSQPLQFTDVTTVAGTASLGGTASSSIPIPSNKPAFQVAQTYGFTPSVTATGSSTVNVANLNTQEFYYGLQTPLTTQQVYYYLTVVFNGLSPYELLPLFISNIEITTDDGKVAVLRNSADSPGSFGRFYSAINFLLEKGLTVEQVKKKKEPAWVGPVLKEDDLKKDSRLLAALVTASSAGAGGSSASSSGSASSGASSASNGSSGGGGSAGLTLQEVKAADGKTIAGYRLQKSGGAADKGSYRFCFSHTVSPVENFSISTKPAGDTLPISLGRANNLPIKRATVTVDKKYYCGEPVEADSSSGSSPQKAAEGIALTTRSLEEIFYFLGEMVRTELGLATGEAASLAVALSDRSEFHLFRVERRLPNSGEPWVSYNGEVFSIKVDPSGRADASSRIVQLLTDLLALQSSAKNLPAPNLIAITTP